MKKKILNLVYIGIACFPFWETARWYAQHIVGVLRRIL